MKRLTQRVQQLETDAKLRERRNCGAASAAGPAIDPVEAYRRMTAGSGTAKATGDDPLAAYMRMIGK